MRARVMMHCVLADGRIVHPGEVVDCDFADVQECGAALVPIEETRELKGPPADRMMRAGSAVTK